MKTVIKRLVFYIQIQLESPLNVASGEDEWTDADILLDFDGNPDVYKRQRTGRCLKRWSAMNIQNHHRNHFHLMKTSEERITTSKGE